MRIRICYSIDASDDYRRAINVYYGKPGLATREEVRRWLVIHGSGADQDLMWALEMAEEESENRCTYCGRTDVDFEDGLRCVICAEADSD